jgi:sporulation-control protein spo0M
MGVPLHLPAKRPITGGAVAVIIMTNLDQDFLDFFFKFEVHFYFQ